MANAKAVGPDELPVELLKLGINNDPTVLRVFHLVIKRVWPSGCGTNARYRSDGEMP